MRIHCLSALACLILVAIAMVVLSSLPTHGQGLDDAITVRYDRDSLRLVPGKEGHVNLNVKSTADVPLWVKLDFYFMKTPGHSMGMIDPDLFQLAPGGSRDVVVDVVSHAHLWQDPDHSDFTVRVTWGSNASNGDIAEPWAGSWQREFNVIDNYTYHDAAIIVGIAVLALAYIWVRRIRRSCTTTGPAQ